MVATGGRPVSSRMPTPLGWVLVEVARAQAGVSSVAPRPLVVSSQRPVTAHVDARHVSLVPGAAGLATDLRGRCRQPLPSALAGEGVS